jgi:ABC-type transporter Mla subunit MlaD
MSVTKSNELLKEGVKEVTEISRTVTEGSQLLESVAAAIETLTKRSEEMSSEVDMLISITKKIAATTSGIKRIADQTTLLSLNAAVEASRAGEAGRGFGVVAQEIRTLSDNTKTLLTTLNDLLEKVNISSDNSKKGVAETFQSIKQINAMSEKLRANMSENYKSTKDIVESMNTMSVFSEEVIAHTNVTAGSIQTSVENVEELYSVANDMTTVGSKVKQAGSSFTDVMNVAGKDTKNLAGALMMTRQFGISNDEFIEILNGAIAAHQKWVRSAENIVDTMTIQPIQTDERNCVFGQYYFSITPKCSYVNNIWQQIDHVHHELHTQGKYILNEVRKGNKRDAQRYLNAAEAHSKVIISKMEEIINYVKTMKISVFARS